MELYLQVITLLALQPVILHFPGNVDVIGTLGSNRNFDVNTNKFTVADHGNTAEGTLDVNRITFLIETLMLMQQV